MLKHGYSSEIKEKIWIYEKQYLLNKILKCKKYKNSKIDYRRETVLNTESVLNIELFSISVDFLDAHKTLCIYVCELCHWLTVFDWVGKKSHFSTFPKFVLYLPYSMFLFKVNTSHILMF